MILFPQKLHLRLRKTGETKHTNLICDMVPSARGTLCLQSSTHTGPHGMDTTAHGPKILLPFRKQLRIVEDAIRNARSVGGGVGNLTPLQHGQLTGNIRHGILHSRRADKVESASPLTVQTQILGKGLRDAQFEPLVDKVPDGPRIAHQVPRCEALVGAVEEGEMLALADHLGNLLPLVLGWVDASRIMGAGMQENDGPGQCRTQGCDHAVKVEALGLGGEVWVLDDVQADIGKDLVMVGPRGVGKVYLRALRMELRDEERSQMHGSCSRNRLNRGHLYHLFVNPSAYKKGQRRRRRPTRFSLIAGLCDPKMSLCEADVYPERPAMGRYS